MKKKIVLTTLILLVLAFATGPAGVQPAQAAPSSLISAGWMPFTGLLYDSQTESIASFNGLVHIITRWTSMSSGQWQVDVDVNLPAANVTVTTDTGVPYTASGAGQSSILFPTDPIIPNDPVFPNDPVRVLVPSFLMVTVGSDRLLPPSPIVPPNPVVPPNPIQPYAFGLQFDLVFSAAGVLDFNLSTVQVVALTGEG
jgi:hypothetical protein